MRALRTIRMLGSLLILPLAVAAAAPTMDSPPPNQPLSGAQTALERYANAFRARSPEGIGAVLTCDYLFHTVGDSLASYTLGSNRAQEMGVMRSLLTGVIRDGVTAMPPADSVGISFDGITEGVDPEHPDSTQHYRTLTVLRAMFVIRLAKGQYLGDAATTHVFHVVRGDAAVLEPGQPASADLWYIRRWLEDVSGLRRTLAQRQGGCGEAPAPGIGPHSGGGAAPATPLALGVHPLANPACSALEVTCDLPGTEPARVEVYDVSGRRVNRREVPVAGPGTITVEAGKGVKLLPGVYWVRLQQAARRPSTRMVIVAR